MKLPDNIFYKIYFFFFAWICLGDLSSLLAPSTDAYIYYHTMKALLPPSVSSYHYALLRAIVNLIALGTLFAVAFNKRQYATWFWRPLFMARIAGDVLGHNYEMQFLKASATSGLKPVLILLTISTLFVLPSYYAHFAYAFRTNKKTTSFDPASISD